MFNLKKIIDLVFSSFAIFILSPLFIAIIVCILIFDGRPIFFFQNRPGLNGKIYKMIKFKTMYPQDKYEGVEDKKRITKLGNILRNSSLDELPELLNVCKGDMSLVGPRPLLEEYLPLYTKEQMKRHDVKPGITGWAQINGRNSLEWEEKFDLDIWYIENRDLLLDIKIIFLTIKKVISREGISADGEATMSKFKGTKNK
ncbi:sugar transferase [Gammaproteobacteria bacterium]|nr:sugar transferase [Gammaproteobacteria bacterium]MDC1251202.1 sugar transferase [Gammaproteobacteria bacterium]